MVNKVCWAAPLLARLGDPPRAVGNGWQRAGSRVPVGEPPVAVAAPSWREESSWERPAMGVTEARPSRRETAGFGGSLPAFP